MKISRRRFSKGLAALVAMIAAPWPTPRRPDPSPPVPCGSLPWSDPGSTPIADMMAAKDLWETGSTFVPADPPLPFIVSNGDPAKRVVQIRGIDANGDEQEETLIPYADGNVVGWLSGPIDMPDGCTITRAKISFASDAASGEIVTIRLGDPPPFGRMRVTS